jgi:hypothetical protein
MWLIIKPMMRTLLGCLLAAFVAGFLMCSTEAKPVDAGETPAQVQTSIHAEVGDGKLDGIDQTNWDGETTFDVNYTTKAGEAHGFTVADDGTVLSVVVELSDAPAAVQAAIRTRAAGWDLDSVNKSLADTQVTYEADVSKTGQAKTFTVDAKGELVCADVTIAEMPAAAQTTVTNRLVGGIAQSIRENIDADGNTFDVVATNKDGGRNAFSVGLDGGLLSMEVSLASIPPEARKTIEAKIGGGKILHLNKSLVEKKDNVLPYGVEGRKDGKPFNFSVGPEGRFLGMDD